MVDQWLTLQPECSSNYTIHINITKIKFGKAKLKFSNCNARLQKSSLAMAELSYKVTRKEAKYSLQIFDTLLGKTTINRGHIHIANSFFGGNSIARNDFNTISVNSSNITFERCTFRNFSNPKGSGAMHALNSSIKIRRSTFLENIGSAGILNITHHSHIEVNDSVIVSNISPGPVGGAITISEKSVAYIYSTNFSQNVAKAGSCLYVTQDSSIHIESSHFEGNHAAHGGAIFADKLDM